MEKKLLKILENKGSIYFTEITKLMPETKGEYAIFMPVKEGVNPNIVWVYGVKQSFIKVFNKLLVQDKIINWNPESLFFLINDCKPIYKNVAVINKRLIKSKKECWMPISIKLNINN
jgi:hypothetical protein